MADSVGILSGAILGAFQSILSANLGIYAFGPAAPARMSASVSGTFARGGFPAVVAWSTRGLRSEMYGGLLFDRIIVIPRDVAAGFVLSERPWGTEVWNAHLAQSAEMTSRGVSGTGNLEVEGPSSQVFGPGQSVVFPTTLPQQGDPVIDAIATWTFTGEPTATLSVTGTRLTLFSFRPDWSEPFRETTSYLTEILTAYDGAEQRRALRGIPRYGATYRVLTCSSVEAALLESLVYGWQDRPYGVPWWPEASPLLADVPVGGQVISVDTTDRAVFQPGGMVVIWRDFATWEAFQADSVSSSSITLSSGALRAWTAGARVVPVRRGRLGDQPLDRPANWISAGTFSFSCEAV